MKIRILQSSCFTLCFSLMCTSFAANKYPYVIAVQGKAQITGGDNIKAPATKGKILQAKALIEVPAGAQIKIQWDPQRVVTFLPETTVQIPAISWESGEAPLVNLKSGRLRWQALGSEQYKVALRSDLFEFLAPPADFIIAIDPKLATAEVQVFDGRMEFSAMNGEESVLVQKGQKAGFQGSLEDGVIAYDLLLQGKKIPRGKLTPVETLSSIEQSVIAKEEANLALEKKKAKQAVVAAAEKKRVTGQICGEPAARFNDCSWTCIGNPGKAKTCLTESQGVSCVRRRCNASGQWSEDLVLSAEKAQSLCKPTPVVGPCDY